VEPLDFGSLGSVDAIALAIVALAAARGVWNGLVREAFSLAGIAAACVAVRFGVGPVAPWLAEHAPFSLSPFGAKLAAGVLLGVGALAAVSLAGRLLRSGARAAGLGLVDRVGGAALGAAEGALVVAIGLLLTGMALPAGHPALARSRAVAIYDEARALARATVPEARDVASPPPARR